MTKRRTALPWILLGALVAIMAPTLFLTIRNGSVSEDPFFIALVVPMLLGYETVGAIVASRAPQNPIGWLLMVFPLGFVLGGLATEYAIYAYDTVPGGLPFRLAAGWISSWAGGVSVVTVPLVITLFPDGRPPSRRWRPLIPATIGSVALLVLATILRPGAMNVSTGIDLQNPTGVPALDGVTVAAVWLGGLGLLACTVSSIVALAMRFARSAGEERQQIRWLVYVTLIGLAMLILALVSSIGLGAGETRRIGDVAFYLFFVFLGAGVPAAIGVAVLRYRLWDLDIVVRKTAIFVGVTVVLLLAGGALLLVVGGIGIGLGVSLTQAEGDTVLPVGLVVGVILGLLATPVYRLVRRLADRIVYGGRADSYEVLTDFGQRLAESYATDDVLERLAALLQSSTGADEATVWLMLGDRLTVAATSHIAGPRQGEHPTGSSTAAPRESDEAFEVRHQGELLGALSVAMPANDRLDGGRRRLVRDLAMQAGLVLRNVRLLEELRASRRRLVAAQDEERRKLERNIHDGVQQQLVALQVQLKLLEQIVERDPTKARELATSLQGASGEALEDLRDLARGIYPPLLADQGLAAALQSQARKAALPVSVGSEGIGRYAQDVEATVYFCCLEALNNVAKYAGASRATVQLTQANGSLTFTVTDDGRGFDTSETGDGTGLQGMADRLDAIGGELEIESSPGVGTTVRGKIPVI